MADATRDAIHIRQVVDEIQGVPLTDTTTMWENNHRVLSKRIGER
jgi:hypothetical protein